jgi:hypothetical protein
MRSGFGATKLNEDLVVDQGQMVEVVQVEYLEVDPGRAESSEAADLVDDLARRAGQRTSAKVVAAPPDRLRPGSHLCVLPQQTVCATEYLAAVR